MTDNVADIAAQAEQTAENETEVAAGQEALEHNETEAGTEEDDESQAEEKKRQANERTQRRRQQRERSKERRERQARIEAEKEAAYWRGRAEASAASSGQAKQDDPAPMREDFETEDDYLDARIDWREKQRASKQEEKPSQPDNPTDGGFDPELQTALNKFKQDGQERHGEDYKDMMEAASHNEFQFTPVMLQASLETEHPSDIAMYFFDNPEESERVARLSPYRQLREIQALAQKIASGEVDTPLHDNRQTGKKISNAPPPITTERNQSSAGVPLSKVKSADEYINRSRRERSQAGRR